VVTDGCFPRLDNVLGYVKLSCWFKDHKCDIHFVMDTQESDKRVFFTNEEWDRLALYMVGNNTRYRDNIIIPRMMGPVKIKTREEKMVEAAFDSCVFKTVMSCVLGKLVVGMIRPGRSEVCEITGCDGFSFSLKHFKD
jgi:hypothetical protein